MGKKDKPKDPREIVAVAINVGDQWVEVVSKKQIEVYILNLQKRIEILEKYCRIKRPRTKKDPYSPI